MKKTVLALAICAMALTGCGSSSYDDAVEKDLIDKECYEFANTSNMARNFFAKYNMCIQHKQLKATKEFNRILSQ